MGEGSDPYQHLAQGSENYKLHTDRLERIGMTEHRVKPRRISKTRSVLLAVLAIILVFGLMAAIASVYLYTFPS